MAARRDPKHDPLFEPITIGPKVMRNRFWRSPSAWSQAVRESRLYPYSDGQYHESRRRLSAGGLAGWNGYYAELD
jgi:2,4-dienoyl-CoA reductase-like NADH-dependent reductase (Old Yellow Enzyme family)